MSRINQAMQDLLRYNGAMLKRERSTFDKSHSHTTTFDSGYIIPLMWDRVLPGDEKEIRFSGLCRMATPIHPVMDECVFDVHAFYVPDRLWWEHAKNFYGENLDADFNPDGEYQMPYFKPSEYLVDTSGGGYTDGVGSLNDFFGFPAIDKIKAEQAGVLALYDADPDLYCTAGLHRSYQLICNEWYRNSSIEPAAILNQGDTVTPQELANDMVLRKSNYLPDYFMTLLREPQAGPDVMLPLAEYAPVVATNEDHAIDQPIKYVDAAGNPYVNLGNVPLGLSGNGSSASVIGVDSSDNLGTVTYAYPSNLWAKLLDTGVSTINNLRSAITIQHFLETQNRAGKRYQSILASFFGVLTPDATLQRPELLGSTRTSLNIRQVIQTSETSNDSPLGNIGAYSLTDMTNELICNKGFTEPGFILVLGTVRPVISYSQGLNPLLTKINLYDHYFPVFDNIGNQPVYNKNLFFSNGLNQEQFEDVERLNGVFGYQEAHTEYKIMNNRVSGLMRPDVPQNLSSWNYAVSYNTVPTLSADFIHVDEELIERTIATPDEPHFICDCYFYYKDTKSMSVHSIPGLQTI